jgi:hypothetical protein
MEVQLLPGAPFLLVRGHHCAERSLRQVAKALVLHTGIPRFESWSERHHLPRSSMAERRPITGRPRFDTVRENQQTKGDHHDDDVENGAAYRRTQTQWTWSVQA